MIPNSGKPMTRKPGLCIVIRGSLLLQPRQIVKKIAKCALKHNPGAGVCFQEVRNILIGATSRCNWEHQRRGQPIAIDTPSDKLAEAVLNRWTEKIKCTRFLRNGPRTFPLSNTQFWKDVSEIIFHAYEEHPEPSLNKDALPFLSLLREMRESQSRKSNNLPWEDIIVASENKITTHQAETSEIDCSLTKGPPNLENTRHFYEDLPSVLHEVRQSRSRKGLNLAEYLDPEQYHRVFVGAGSIAQSYFAAAHGVHYVQIDACASQSLQRTSYYQRHLIGTVMPNLANLLHEWQPGPLPKPRELLKKWNDYDGSRAKPRNSRQREERQVVESQIRKQIEEDDERQNA